MSKFTIHEDDVEGVQLPGRFHKMVVKPENMDSTKMCAGVAFFPLQVDLKDIPASLFAGLRYTIAFACLLRNLSVSPALR